MAKYPFFVAAIFLPTFLMGGQDAIRLQYPLNQAVVQTSSLDIEISQGNDEVPSIAHQEVRAKLAVTASNSPRQLEFTLQSLQVGVESEGNALQYDSTEPRNSPLMTEIAKILNRPLKVVVDSNLKIGAESKEFLKFSQTLEHLGGFRATNLLSETLQNLFVLADKDIHEGETYHLDMALGADPNVKMEISYHIVAITDKEVRAEVSGGFDSVEILRFTPHSAERLFLEGNIRGKAVWSRKNALIYKTRIDYSYNGVLEGEGREIPVELHIHHEDSSRAI